MLKKYIANRLAKSTETTILPSAAAAADHLAVAHPEAVSALLATTPAELSEALAKRNGGKKKGEQEKSRNGTQGVKGGMKGV